jgi:hypothetical protein
LYTFDKTFRPEPAGRQTSASSRHLTSPGQGADHSLDVVVSVRRLLPPTRAANAIADQEQPYGYLTLNQIQAQAQRVIGAFVTIWAVVDDDENLIFCSLLPLLS